MSTPPLSLRPPLVSPEDIKDEIMRLFDGAGSNMRVTVYGGDGSDGEEDAYRELLESLKMHDKDFAKRTTSLVATPDVKVITKALLLLANAEHKKRLLDHVLTTFGCRLIDPLAAILDRTSEGTLMPRLRIERDILFSQVTTLQLTPESQGIMLGDLRKLLTDDYLTMIAEHEERVQRPRVNELAQQILRLIGSTFYRALRSWPEHAQQIAQVAVRQMGKKTMLKDAPGRIRSDICAAIEEFLWVETSTELSGALSHLFAQNSDLIQTPPRALDRAVYRDFADACWTIIEAQ